MTLGAPAGCSPRRHGQNMPELGHLWSLVPSSAGSILIHIFWGPFCPKRLLVGPRFMTTLHIIRPNLNLAHWHWPPSSSLPDLPLNLSSLLPLPNPVSSCPVAHRLAVSHSKLPILNCPDPFTAISPCRCPLPCSDSIFSSAWLASNSPISSTHPPTKPLSHHNAGSASYWTWACVATIILFVIGDSCSRPREPPCSALPAISAHFGPHEPVSAGPRNQRNKHIPLSGFLWQHPPVEHGWAGSFVRKHELPDISRQHRSSSRF